MPTTIIVNLQMSYRCKVHQDVELSAFRPMNESTFSDSFPRWSVVQQIEPCIKCVREKDALHNQIAILQQEFNKACLTKLEQTKAKPKRKPSLYLDGRKINFVTKKKGGKK